MELQICKGPDGLDTCRRCLAIAIGVLALGVAPLAHAAEIAITQPTPEEVIHDNLGDVVVSTSVAGAPGGSRVRVSVDGAARGTAGVGGAITLHGIERGTHVLKAELLGPDGAVLAVSAPVTFHFWQASRLNPHRRPK